MFGKMISLIWTARKRVKLIWLLLNDQRIPMWKKLVPLAPFIYIFSPLNLISFAIPFVGQIDDAVLFVLAADLFERLIDKDILDEYQQQ